MAQFSEVLAEIGGFGRFQVQLLLLLSVPNLLSAFYMFGQVFMALEEPHYCSVSWVKNLTFNLSAAEQLNLSVPLDAAGNPEPCRMFRPPPDGASLEDILSRRSNETQPCEAGWEYPEDRPLSLKNEVGCLWACLSTCLGSVTPSALCFALRPRRGCLCLAPMPE